ncbi:GntR family transcriptional regulator [Paraburkholderia hospita]|uniref:GntR family transcriptional regulator n=1 Tax=Paraburkholderia hospita TaxID=169430 RepID=A0ABP2PX96_9BURK|nr:PLP-dependent aminotransferase family protein [Paraburkholderia hospita]EIN02204.1 GntR family transcriptional regulator [Paraburkholderia hospita]OUL90163.1 GntR family transcriptional regulator [Paraburkholderia hospita]
MTNRYETLANTMATEIRAGRVPAGSRMPSLRQLTTQHGVSQATASRAYYLLEEWGLIRARERSGYYVAPGASMGVAERLRPHDHTDPGKVDISTLVFSVLEAARNPGIVPLGSAFPSPQLFPLPRLAKSLGHAARLINPWNTVVDLPPGNEHLRRQIALRYMAMGMPQPVEDVVITNGALEALNLCLMAVTRPGDVVAVESPSFYAALQAIERLDLRAVEIPVDPESGLNFEELENALEKHEVKACWFMTNFQNPTGTSLSLSKKKALVELLTRYDVPLIEDDVYGELHFQPEYPLPAKAFDKEGLVMHCSSFSKTLAPGYRVGWVSAGKFTATVQNLKLMTTLSASIPAQAGIADYLQHGGYDKHLRKLRCALREQLEDMEQALRQWLPANVHWVRPDGGYFLWLKLPHEVEAMELHRRAISQGLSLAPGPIFSATHGYRQWIRINFGHPLTTKVEGSIKILGQLLAEIAAAQGQSGTA